MSIQYDYEKKVHSNIISKIIDFPNISNSFFLQFFHTESPLQFIRGFGKTSNQAASHPKKNIRNKSNLQPTS